MNMANITDNDLKLMREYLKDKEDLSDELKDLSNKLEYCVLMINLRNEYMDNVDNINKQFEEKLKKEDK
jgi:hypothetical protein